MVICATAGPAAQTSAMISARNDARMLESPMEFRWPVGPRCSAYDPGTGRLNYNACSPSIAAMGPGPSTAGEVMSKQRVNAPGASIAEALDQREREGRPVRIG